MKKIYVLLSLSGLLLACESDFKAFSNSSLLSQTGTVTIDPIDSTDSSDSKVPIVCNATEHIENNTCVSNLKVCKVLNGVGEQTWDGTKYGACLAKTCNASFHVENNQCLANTKACEVLNGAGEQTWDGAKYRACLVRTCNVNFHIESNKCLSNTKACLITNGTGQQTWDGVKYGACTLKSCNSGYQVTTNSCTPSFVGKWQNPCAKDGSLDSRFINNYMDDTKHELIMNQFYNPTSPGSCSTPYRTIRQTGTYTRVGLSTTAPSGVNLDFYHPTIIFTLHTDQAVKDHNLSAVCGKINWTKGVAYSFSQAACKNESEILVKTVNKVDGATLYVGDFTGITDLTIRPTQLSKDPLSIFKKIP